MFEPPNRKIMHISDTPPDGDPKYIGWIDTATRTGKVYEGGQWVVKFSFAENGYTGEVKAGNKTFTFKNGILIAYE